MPAGPFLIFDKSTLQSLNPDEATWLDHFFQSNITPLFFIETLADLEKQVHAGRTPEQVVGNLAYKTPDLSSRANVHHLSLVSGELLRRAIVPMEGIPIVGGGKPVAIGDKKGMIFTTGPEDEALRRWQCGEFLDVERQIAKFWRRALSSTNLDAAYLSFRKWFDQTGIPKSLEEVKSVTDKIIDDFEQGEILNFGCALLGIPEPEMVRREWRDMGKPPIRKLFPYFRHVFSVELFFYIAIAADLVSRERPSNKVDFAYLYYLPFCKIFTSSDRLHAKTAPLFLRSDQTFLDGASLKADLKRVDEHYSSLPEEVKARGTFSFALYPPLDDSFLVTQLWDKHQPDWRGHQADAQRKPPLSKEVEAALVGLASKLKKEGVPLNPRIPLDRNDISSLSIERKVYPKKGKWTRFPPEALEIGES